MLKALPCDIFLGAHGIYFGMLGKLEQLKLAPGSDVWVDPHGYQTAVADWEQQFRDELKKQRGKT